MNTFAEPDHLHQHPSTLLRGPLILTGVVLAAAMDAIASTALSIGRIGLFGDIHATPDELALADITFVTAKLVGFLVVPMLVTTFRPTACLRAATAALLLSCAAMTLSSSLVWIYLCRSVQGVAGGAVLVAGQTLLFSRFARKRQPTVQAVFAIGAIMAPTTLTPALQGWVVDHLSWGWIFLSTIPLGIAALVLLAADGERRKDGKVRLPFVRISLLSMGAAAITYVLQQGSRFNWFDDGHIVWLTLLGIMTLGIFILLDCLHVPEHSLIRTTALRHPGFRFGIVVSLVAGFALSGTSYLIPAFALNVLGFTATAAGTLLLPSGVMLGLGLILGGIAMETGVKPFALVPFGLALFAGAMWLLSGATSVSGTADLTFPLLLRGIGLGFLFISLTIVALSDLDGRSLASGIGLFNFCKQLGGLLGPALLQTYVDHQSSLARTILSAHLVAGNPHLEERLRATATALAAQGLTGDAASKAAAPVLQQMLGTQVAVIAFDQAFFGLVLFFAATAPVLVLAKRLLNRPSTQGE